MDDVYHRLRADITSGELPPGAALVETQLATRYHVSRTPVREALRRLQQDGVVERADRSMRVRPSSPEEILEIYDVRVTLEGLAARTAAEQRGDYDLTRLRGLADRMRALGTADTAAMVTQNRLFHEAVWAASHNATLVDLLTRLHTHLLRYPETTLDYPGRWQEVLDEHDGLLAAIVARDGETARRLAERHMTGARDVRLRMYGAAAPSTG